MNECQCRCENCRMWRTEALKIQNLQLALLERIAAALEALVKP